MDWAFWAIKWSQPCCSNIVAETETTEKRNHVPKLNQPEVKRNFIVSLKKSFSILEDQKEMTIRDLKVWKMLEKKPLAKIDELREKGMDLWVHLDLSG